MTSEIQVFIIDVLEPQPGAYDWFFSENVTVVSTGVDAAFQVGTGGTWVTATVAAQQGPNGVHTHAPPGRTHFRMIQTPVRVAPDVGVLFIPQAGEVT